MLVLHTPAALQNKLVLGTHTNQPTLTGCHPPPSPQTVVTHIACCTDTMCRASDTQKRQLSAPGQQAWASHQPCCRLHTTATRAGWHMWPPPSEPCCAAPSIHLSSAVEAPHCCTHMCGLGNTEKNHHGWDDSSYNAVQASTHCCTHCNTVLAHGITILAHIQSHKHHTDGCCVTILLPTRQPPTPPPHKMCPPGLQLLWT